MMIFVLILGFIFAIALIKNFLYIIKSEPIDSISNNSSDKYYSDDYDKHLNNDDDDQFDINESINPATSLPMIGDRDVFGNQYGFGDE